MKVKRIAVAAVLAACTAACAAARADEPGLSPELLLPGHAATNAFKPAIAYADGVYLLVWQAGRNEHSDIVGLRLDKSGKPTDPKPFVISAAKDSQDRPRVAFGGGIFLVTWYDLRNGKDFDVYAARVTPAGKVLDPDGIAVAAAERSQCEPGLCWDGRNFQVLWRGYQGSDSLDVVMTRMPAAGYYICGGRVSADGKVLDGDGILMAKPLRRQITPLGMGMVTAALLPDGKVLAAALTGETQCLWRIVDGKPVSEPVPVTLGGGGGYDWRTGYDDQAFASNGKTVLLCWTSFVNRGGRGGGNLRGSGMIVLGPGGEIGTAVPQTLGATPNYNKVATAGRYPAPAWDGRRYVVAWNVPLAGKDFHYDALLMRTFAGDGKPLSDDQPVVDDPASPASRPAAASDGAGTTVIAYERHARTGDVPTRIGVRVLEAE